MTGETLLARLQALTPEQLKLQFIVKARNDVGYAINDRLELAQCDDKGEIVTKDDEPEHDYEGGPVLLLTVF
jgi:hypothetical protein